MFELFTPQLFLPNQQSVNTTFKGHLHSHTDPDVFVTPSILPENRKFSLIVEEMDWEVAPGQFISVWTFNGTIPGPTLGVYAGDTVEVTIINHLREPISLDFLDSRSQTRLNNSVSQAVVSLNSYKVISFGIPLNSSGTWIYRDTIAYKGLTEEKIDLGISSTESVERGLYGAFIVYDRGVSFPDHDVVIFLDSFKPPVTANNDYFAVQNGGSYPFGPHYVFQQGELIRYRAINIDIGTGGDPHTTHVHGHTWGDEENRTVDNELLLPGESIDVLIRARKPGIWMYHCHIYDHIAAGMTGMLSIVPEFWTGDPLDYVALLMEDTALCGLP
ncbi:MAG: multicopper oxidase domain-containing protein [Candidatus Thorarchaeota archaeon]